MLAAHHRPDLTQLSSQGRLGRCASVSTCELGPALDQRQSGTCYWREGGREPAERGSGETGGMGAGAQHS